MRYPLYGCDGAPDVLQGGLDYLEWYAKGDVWHPGVDLNSGNSGDADLGAIIEASAPGIVRHITHWDGRTVGYGTHLWIEHSDGHYTHHAHLETVLVTWDQPVARGDKIARCGKSGFQTWAHDHFEVTRSSPADWSQWPRGWSRAQVEAVYRNPHEWLAEKQAEALSTAGGTSTDMQGIIDELNGQVAALRAEIEAINGVNTELGKQVNSLSWLLSVSQGETQAQAAEVARLLALAAAGPVAASTAIAGITVTYEDGSVEQFGGLTP